MHEHPKPRLGRIQSASLGNEEGKRGRGGAGFYTQALSPRRRQITRELGRRGARSQQRDRAVQSSPSRSKSLALTRDRSRQKCDPAVLAWQQNLPFSRFPPFFQLKRGACLDCQSEPFHSGDYFAPEGCDLLSSSHCTARGVRVGALEIRFQSLRRTIFVFRTGLRSFTSFH